MNNVKYIEQAIDSLSDITFDEGRVSNIRVTYKKECYLGDRLALKIIGMGNQIQVQFYKKEEHICLITFTLKKNH